MKKIIISAILAACSGIVMAESPPELLTSVFALYMSPNGKWVGSQAGYAAIYNTESKELERYSGVYLGVGNSVADNGTAVGDGNDGALVIINGEVIYPVSLNSDRYCSPNAITRDATRMAGYMSVPGGNFMEYVPFVADLDENGNVSEPLPLPVPEVDFFGTKPSYITAQCISDDGKMVIGMVIDGRGMYSYPICFIEDEVGEWSYQTPSEVLFNPTHIEIPANPWYDSPSYPYPVDYMSANAAEAYEEAFRNWNSGIGPQPYVEDYMTGEQYAAYLEAVDTYNYWYEHQDEIINRYISVYNEIIGTSPVFDVDILALKPSGDCFAAHGGVIDEYGDMIGKIYNFYITGEIEEIEGPTSAASPRQILSDGTMVVSNTTMYGLDSWFLFPDKSEFITVQDYLAPKYPELVDWMNENLSSSGAVTVSEDLSVIAGALTSDLLRKDDFEESFRFASYVFTGLESAGVRTLENRPQDGVYRVFNLQGLKILETKDAGQIYGLPKGIYIINGKKVII